MAKKKAKPKKKAKAKKAKATRHSFDAITSMLIEKRDTILDEIARGVREVRHASRRADPADMASETADGAVGLELYQAGSSELAQIEAALGKIGDGTYGLCAICEESIPLARLRALPFATQCVKCKERQELIERARQGGGSWAPMGGVGADDEADQR